MRREERARKLGLPIDQLPDGRGRHGNHVKGPRHPRWNDGRMLSDQGYVKVRVGRSHPLADSNGYAYEHDLVMVAAIGRPLLRSEVVHHRNEDDKLDNRIENLQLLTRGDHSQLHDEARGRDEGGRFLPQPAREAA